MYGCCQIAPCYWGFLAENPSSKRALLWEGQSWEPLLESRDPTRRSTVSRGQQNPGSLANNAHLRQGNTDRRCGYGFNHIRAWPGSTIIIRDYGQELIRVRSRASVRVLCSVQFDTRTKRIKLLLLMGRMATKCASFARQGLNLDYFFGSTVSPRATPCSGKGLARGWVC